MSEDMSGEMSSLTFSGEHEDCALWWMRFKAHGLVKGFSQALTSAQEASLPTNANDVLDLTNEDGKKANIALSRNDLAIACMTMAFATESLMNKVCKARAVACPGGLVHLVVENLMEEFRPKDELSKVEAQKRFMAI